MTITQVANKQVGSPDRLPVAEIARIGIKDLLDKRSDSAGDGSRTAGAFAVREPISYLQISALLKPSHPVVDGLPRDARPPCDLADRDAGSQPRDCQRSTQN